MSSPIPRRISRRHFLKQANCAAVGSISLFSSLFSLRLTAAAATLDASPDKKALVCLFLNGGNDSFNMLVPRQAEAYSLYAETRSSVALASDSLLPIESTGQSFAEFGLHPDLPFLHRMYGEGKAAFVSNVGTLIEPLTLGQYKSKEGALPLGLFSHSDQQIHWQTVVPQVRGSSPKGWAGRMADCIHEANTGSSVGMNISLSGSNVMQTGNGSVPYITDHRGAIKLVEYEVDPLSTAAIDSLLSLEYRNLYEKTLAPSNRKAIDTAITFENAVSPVSLSTTFPTTQTGRRLEMIARILVARDNLSMNRQVFFINRGGWDHHNELLIPQSALLSEVDEAMEAFWTELGLHGLQEDVVLFSASDFGRTLTSNGLGTDHAWAGNHFVLGGQVNGGRIYGSYPELASGSALDIGRGRILPTTSVDEYSSEIASWFGVPASELSTVFPNSGNFFDPLTNPYPLGFLQPSS